MYQRVRAYVEQQHMLDKSDKVITGVSGGADSICLLFVLLKLKNELGFSLTAVHIHHGLRGGDADADEEYVKKVCREQKVELQTFHADVRDYADIHKLTEEEAGRELRRSALLETCRRQKGTKIALAHHMNDNVETFLWNLCRGTGIKGMGGIAPVSGIWIRPLLCVKRLEIESYLNELGIHYCTDKTNFTDDYTRNRLRNHVVPYLESQINERSVEHMAFAAEKMRRLNSYLEDQVTCYVNRCAGPGGSSAPKDSILIRRDVYEDTPDVLKSHILFEVLCRAAGRSKDIESVHVQMLKGLMEKQTGRQIDLPYGLAARRCYEGVLLGRAAEAVREWEEEAHYSMHIISKDEAKLTFEDNPYTKCFDYDIIKNTVKIRHRMPGDYITIDKNGNTQKLKKYFINEKVEAELRDRVWLVADGSHILWIVGFRQNQYYQVTDKTKQILVIEFDGGEIYERDN